MPTNEPQAFSPHEPLFDREAFEKLARDVLSELRAEVQQNMPSHTIDELQSISIWKCKLPSLRDDALSVLFETFPLLRESFDPTQTARSLCTLDNLATLLENEGVLAVARVFREYFETRATQKWSVLIPLENVVIRDKLPAIKGQTVCLRRLGDGERERLCSLRIPSERLDAFYFAVEVEAGDSQRAVEKAREMVEQFIAPYYLHRMRSPDRWWRARTIRQIISPLAFYLDSQSMPGMNRELRQLPTEASDLFTPSPNMDPQWQTAVESLIRTWRKPSDDLSELEKCLQVCARWMFAAETEENLENAFLKHGIAWEGLLPDCGRIRRGWYLLLLSIGACDPLCVKTVSQAGRLTDRRNSLAHPEIARELYGNVEQDLCMLKQSLRWAFDRGLVVRQRVEFPGARTYEWPELLRRTFDALSAEHFSADTDGAVLDLLADLDFTEQDPENSSRLRLNEGGHVARAEALLTKARECWDEKQDPKASVAHLSRAYRIAIDQNLLVPQYHLLLTLRERRDSMEKEVFGEAWAEAGTGIPEPSACDIKRLLEKMERDHGARPERVGWKR